MGNQYIFIIKTVSSQSPPWFFLKVLKKFSINRGKYNDRYSISMQTPVENPLMTMENFNRQFQLGEKESCYAMRHAPWAMRFSIPGRPNLKGYQQKRVIDFRRLG
jgi:hypothetical protein